jgi:hypothetical protein
MQEGVAGCWNDADAEAEDDDKSYNVMVRSVESASTVDPDPDSVAASERKGFSAAVCRVRT